jgi:hypothetical protein
MAHLARLLRAWMVGDTGAVLGLAALAHVEFASDHMCDSL